MNILEEVASFLRIFFDSTYTTDLLSVSSLLNHKVITNGRSYPLNNYRAPQAAK